MLGFVLDGATVSIALPIANGHCHGAALSSKTAKPTSNLFLLFPARNKQSVTDISVIEIYSDIISARYS